jgi:hypothetical protein
VWDYDSIDKLYDDNRETEEKVFEKLHDYFRGYYIKTTLNTDEEKYNHSDIRIQWQQKVCKVEVESSTQANWLKQTPPDNWSSLNILSRKAINDWDVFIKVSPFSDYNLFWCCSMDGFIKAHKAGLVKTEDCNDNLKINTDHTKDKINLSVLSNAEYKGMFITDDWEALYAMIFKQIVERK